MALHVPFLMQELTAGTDPDLTYTAQEIRMYHTALGVITGNAVLTPADFNVTQRGAGANFSVDVAAGLCGVTGDDIASQGLYLAWNDATVNVACPAAPGSGTRNHRLVLQVRDKVSNGTYTTYDCILSLLQDTGAGTPAEPASALTLALVSETVGQVSVTNANITFLAPSAKTRFVATGQAYTSTSDVAVAGITAIPVTARQYHVRGTLSFQQGGGTPGFNLKFQGPSATGIRIFSDYTQDAAGGTVNSAHTTALATAITSPAYAAAAFFFCEFEAVITFTAAGQFGLTGNTTTGGTITLEAGSVLTLVPV